MTTEEMAFRLRELATAIEASGEKLAIGVTVAGAGKLATLRHIGNDVSPAEMIGIIGAVSLLHTSLVDDYYSITAPADNPAP